MCGRYQLNPSDSAEIAIMVQQVQDRIKTGEMFPTNPVPVLTNLTNELAPRPMIRGFPKFGSNSGSIINARSETAGDKPTFRKSLYERRCIFPTTGFFEGEPGEAGEKTKYRFNLPGDKALYLAGLWSDFAGEERCVILTTAANQSMDKIHDRMPVVLTHETMEPWVFDTDAAIDILRAVPQALVHEIA